MPEDLRSQEDSLLAKKKTDYQPEVVRPDEPAYSSSRREASGSGHWWQRWFRPLTFGFRRNKSSGDDDSILREVARQNIEEQGLAKQDLQLEEREPLEYKPAQVSKIKKSIDPAKTEDEEADQMIKQKKDKAAVLPQPAPFSESVLKADWRPTPPAVNAVSTPLPAPEAESVLDRSLSQQPYVRELVPPPLPEIPVKALEMQAEKPEMKEEIKPTQLPRLVPESAEPEPIVKEEKPPFKEKGEKETEPSKGEVKFHQPQPRIRARFLEDGGVDLIPAAARIKNARQILNISLLALLAAALVVGLFYGALYYQKNTVVQKSLNQTRQISDLEREILDFAEINEEIKQLGDEIRLVDEALNKHVYWTNFFALLEQYTIPEVYYKGFSAGKEGALTLEAVGTDFYAVARQLKVLQQTEAQGFVDRADVSTAALTEEGVNFNLVLILNPNLFYYKE